MNRGPDRSLDPSRDPSLDPSLNHGPPVRTRWAWLWATWFGAGLMKPGPGTWGSVAAAGMWFAAARLVHPALAASSLAWITAAAAIGAVAIGVPAGTIVARESGREDPGFVVIDEVAGQWIALIACPVDWRHALLALLMFRAFDIVKPFPARQLEKLRAGWGIVFDDVAAGLYALLVVQIARHWF